MKIRKATRIDISSIARVEKGAWPAEMAADERKIESRINTFPEGQLVAVENGEIIGVVSTEIIKYDFNKKSPSWYEATDNGYIKNTHSLDGNVIFGVDLSVMPSSQNRGVAKRLLEEIGKMAIKRNLQFGILGGRLPGYHKYAKELTVDEYMQKTTPDGEPFDPELRFYKNSGLIIGEVIPNYFKDFQSNNYGVQLVWKNPFYSSNKLLGMLIGKILSYFFKVG